MHRKKRADMNLILTLPRQRLWRCQVYFSGLGGVHGLCFNGQRKHYAIFSPLSENRSVLNRAVIDKQGEQIEAVVVSGQIMADFFLDDDRGVDIGVKNFFSAAIRTG